MNPSTTIATPEQISDKIEFVACVNSWSQHTQWRDFVQADIELSSADLGSGGEGVIIKNADLKICAIAQGNAQPVPRGTLFKVTIERVS